MDSNSDPSDAALISASATKPELFAQIFDRHFPSVHQFLERRAGHERADSLTGDVFRIAFERRSSYDVTHLSCLPWLYGIANNLIKKEHRREARHTRAVHHLAGQRDTVISGLEGIDQRIDAEMAWPQVLRALADLSEDERDLVLLIAWEDLSYEQVASVLGIPIGTVRSRLHRARKRLRELIATDGKESSWTQQESAGKCRR